MKRSVAILALLLAVTLSGAAKARDSLTIGITQYPATLHPTIESMLATSYVTAMARRSLTGHDADWELVCLLCVEIPTLENGGAVIETQADGSDGIGVTFALHPGATWGDGTPVTSADVVFTWQVGRHPAVPYPNREMFERITDITVIDDKTFTLHVDRVTFDYNSFGGLDVLPAHLERPVFERDPAGYAANTLYDTDPTNKGLWFGPYRVAEVEPGARVRLVRNETWFGGRKPAFDAITVKAIPNTAALEANLLAGDVDYIAGEMGLTLDQALDFERRHGERFTVITKPGLIYEHITLDLDHPGLGDVAVRRALLHAIDRAAISDRLFGGRQPVALSNVSPNDPVFTHDVTRHPFDLARAARLLTQAGWPLAPDGIRRNGAGEPLALTLSTTAGNRVRELVQQVIVQSWKDLGIAVTTANKPARVFFGDIVSKREFDGGAMFAWISAPDSVPRSTLHSEMIPSEANGWAGQNYSGFENARADALIHAIETELDEQQRAGLWRELQALYAEELPALPLYFRANPFVLPKWLAGVTPTGHMDATTNWVETWRVAEEAQ